MSNSRITQISLKVNETLEKRTTNNTKRRYWMVGKEAYVNEAPKGAKAEWQLKGIDFISTFANLSKREQRFIVIYKDHIVYDKEANTYRYDVKLSPDAVIFDKECDNFMEYKSFLKAYQALHKIDLARRISKHTYMLNPDFFVISGNRYLEFMNIWSEAKQYKP